MPPGLVQFIIPFLQAVALLGAVGLIAGCSIASREPAEPSSQINGSLAGENVIPPSSKPCTRESFRYDDQMPCFWLSDEPLRLELSPSTAPAEPSPAPAIREENLFSLDYVGRIGRDINATFTAPARWDTGDWLVLGGVATGVGVAMAFDKDIQKGVQRNRNATADHVFKAIEPFGNEYSFAVLGAFYLEGEIFQDARARSVALDGLSASLIASALIGQPLKYAVGRSRPGQGRSALHFQPFDGDDSFPSGHALQAFAVATVIAEHYDEPWIKVASYGLASAVGVARVNNNAHWTSDVLAGAAIGVFVGETVVHLNRNRALALTPIFAPDLKGLELTWSY